MENNPFGRSNHETPKAGSDAADKESKPAKKSSASAEATPPTDKNIKASKDIGQSIFNADKPKRESVESALFAALDKSETSTAESKKTTTESETSSDELAERAAIETLSPDERQHVIQEIARERLDEFAENSELDDESQQPAVELLRRTSEGEDIEVVFADIANEMGLNEDEIAEALADIQVEADVEIASEDSDDDEAMDDIDPAELSEEGEVDLTVPTPIGGGRSGGARGGGASLPPSGQPTGPTSSTGPGSAGNSGAAGTPLPATPNVVRASHEEQYQEDRRAKAGQLLVVGLVGYLYGRRRGRIKTEKRLLPVQRKLEKQVKQLQRDVITKEQLLVAAKARTEVEQPMATPSRKVPAANRQETKPYVAAERTQPGRKETRLGMEKPVRAERLGHMVIAAEVPRQTIKPERFNNIRQAFHAEQVKDMHRNELLELSEKIVVEGASLRRIYESSLIGEKQLRHLVSEYLQGKDIRKDLRKEMVEHEIDFERDPIMRDRIRSHLEGGGKGGLNEMLASVGITNEDDEPELAARVRKQEQRAAEMKQRQVHRQQVAAQSALITAVVVLAVAVLILALRS